jgi:DNA-directed RNA polymerase subunit K/omega
MIRRPTEMGKFEFAVAAGLRAAQLVRGCVPRVEGDHSTATFAQLEVAEGKVISTITAATADDEHASSDRLAPGSMLVALEYRG